jgi:hypothetical protein
MRALILFLVLLGLALAQGNGVQKLEANELASFFQNRVTEVVGLGMPSGVLEGVLLEGLKNRRLSLNLLLGKADQAKARHWIQAGAKVGLLEGQVSGGVLLINHQIILMPNEKSWLLVQDESLVFAIGRQIDQVWNFATRRQ